MTKKILNGSENAEDCKFNFGIPQKVIANLGI